MKAILVLLLVMGTARADGQRAMNDALAALDWIGDADLAAPATARRLAGAAEACARDIDAALADGESPIATRRVVGPRTELLVSLADARARLCGPLAAISARMPALARQAAGSPAAGQRACAGVPSSRCPRSSSTRRSRRLRSPR